jgi:hypothetical protein
VPVADMLQSAAPREQIRRLRIGCDEHGLPSMKNGEALNSQSPRAAHIHRD